MTPSQEREIEKMANISRAAQALAIVLTDNYEQSDDDLIEIIGHMAKSINKRAARALINEINKPR